jgi:hypothetical protein
MDNWTLYSFHCPIDVGDREVKRRRRRITSFDVM